MTTTTATPATADAAVGSPALTPGGADPAGGISLLVVTKTYGTAIGLDNLTLDIPAGSRTAIVGPSGSGKSTLLHVIAGLEPPTSGRLLIDGTDVTALGPGHRDLGMVFQDYALYPHLTVAKNIGFPLTLKIRKRYGKRPSEVAEEVRAAAAQFGLETLLHRKPHQLSGGQRQRVALARAIIKKPAALLLDEPLSALDAQLRASARAEIIRLHQDIRCTMAIVTHDQHEALSMATHLVVMDAGRIIQAGSPEQLYQEPANEFVASFVGTPAMNIHTLPGHARCQSPESPHRTGWRPADGTIHTPATSGNATGVIALDAVVGLTEYLGEQRLIQCGHAHDGTTLRVLEPASSPLRRIGETITITVPVSRTHNFDAAGNRIDAHG